MGQKILLKCWISMKNCDRSFCQKRQLYPTLFPHNYTLPRIMRANFASFPVPNIPNQLRVCKWIQKKRLGDDGSWYSHPTGGLPLKLRFFFHCVVVLTINFSPKNFYRLLIASLANIQSSTVRADWDEINGVKRVAEKLGLTNEHLDLRFWSQVLHNGRQISISGVVFDDLG